MDKKPVIERCSLVCKFKSLDTLD